MARKKGGLSYVCAGREPASVYVCQFSNGLVKVGFTSNARTRLASLQCQAQRTFGVYMVCFKVFGRAGYQRGCISTNAANKTARAIEKVSIKQLSAIGVNIPPFTEFFTGVSFTQAVLVVEEAIGNQPTA